MQERKCLFCRRIVPAMMVVFLVLGALTAAQAAPYFEGKSITFVVPSSPGGGTDFFGRMVGRHLSGHIPGKPAMVIRNMPAAGGMTGGNHAYKSRPNGRTVLVATAKSVMANILRPKGIVFELQKMYPLYSSPIGLTFYAKPEFIKEPKDIMTAKGLVFGHGAPTTGTTSGFIWPMELLGFKVERAIFGYGGSGDARLAFLSGEVNVSGGSTLDFNAHWKGRLERGELVPIFQSGVLDGSGNMVREQAAPDIPTVKELYEQVYGKKPSGPIWEICKLVTGVRTVGKCIDLPPKTPKKIVKIYSDAVDRMMKDQKFLKESERANPGAPHFVGKELVRIYPKGVSGDPELIKTMKKILNEKYGVVFD